MNTHADKTQENKSQSVANQVVQKRNSNKPTFQFIDNRPEAIAQRKMKEIIDNKSNNLVQRMRSTLGQVPVGPATEVFGFLGDTPERNALQQETPAMNFAGVIEETMRYRKNLTDIKNQAASTIKLPAFQAIVGNFFNDACNLSQMPCINQTTAQTAYEEGQGRGTGPAIRKYGRSVSNQLYNHAVTTPADRIERDSIAQLISQAQVILGKLMSLYDKLRK
ncbi:MAG: hypothetical protein R8N23_09585 [Reichenbachiella sp.]|uniref:hypothetical protein n=1 Tax=Reichenbachiella sp. TaxID=2184521 RepID=UPI002966BBC2|nr:hypothetical protein [Reichenbachiella sp.]MDW3210109.1 hypothetical protein [Reichenbachiella sp.]